MKSLVVYSSQTGNTRKLAEAVFEALPAKRHYTRSMRHLILSFRNCWQVKMIKSISLKGEILLVLNSGALHTVTNATTKARTCFCR